MLADGDIALSGQTQLAIPLYFGKNTVFSGSSSIKTIKGKIFQAFDYFDFRNLFAKPLESVQRYFGNRESKELAFLMGRIDANALWVKVKSITLETPQNPSDCHPSELNYKADIDFHLWDGTTFDPNDRWIDEVVSITESVVPTHLTEPLTSIAEALGHGWTLQQTGMGRPRFNVVKLNDVLSGTVDNPNHDDCPPTFGLFPLPTFYTSRI